MENYIKTIVQASPLLLQGAGVTLLLAAFGTVLGMMLGTVLGIARLSSYGIVRLLARCYIDFVRGTPLLVQIFIIYFGLPGLAKSMGWSFSLNQLSAAVLALTLNSAAYLAEIIRGGIQSIEIGQREAAESLGLGPVETMAYVIFPQAFRRMIPPLGNEFIALLKDTSLVSVIGFTEVLQQGKLIVAQNYKSFEIYTAVAIVYLVMTIFSSQVFERLELWMNPVERSKREARIQDAAS